MMYYQKYLVLIYLFIFQKKQERVSLLEMIMNINQMLKELLQRYKSIKNKRIYQMWWILWRQKPMKKWLILLLNYPLKFRVLLKIVNVKINICHFVSKHFKLYNFRVKVSTKIFVFCPFKNGNAHFVVNAQIIRIFW